jgi:hypothetical protein
MRALSLIVAMALALPATGVAQLVPDSLISRRVRIFLTPLGRDVEGAGAAQLLRGELTKVTPDSITLSIHPGVTPISVAGASVRYLEVSRGVSRGRTAVGLGLKAALVWGALGGSMEDDVSPFVWAGAGFVIGGIAGALLPQEHWRTVFSR